MSVGTRWRIWTLGLLAVVAAAAGVLVSNPGSRAATPRNANTPRHANTSRRAPTSRTTSTTPTRPTTGTAISVTGVAPTAAALAKGRWRALARFPLGRREGAVVSWDGSTLLEIGGDNGGENPQALDSGAAYSPATKRWRVIAPAPAGVDPDNAASVWTGTKLFVFGSPSGSAVPTEVAGLYDPATNTWTTTAPAPVNGLAEDDATAVWTGTQVILAGTSIDTSTSGTGSQFTAYVLSYDPSTGQWSNITPSTAASHPPQQFAMVATNDGVLLWSQWSQSQSTPSGGGESTSGTDVFRYLNGVWTQPSSPWPSQNETIDQPLFTGTTVLLGSYQIWCGYACPAPMLPYSNGREVNPRTLKVTAIPRGPLGGQPQILWSGDAEITFNAEAEISGPAQSTLPGDIAFWDPRSRRWYRGPRAPFGASDLPAVWDGGAMLVLSAAGKLYRYGVS